MAKQVDFTNRMDNVFETWEYHLFEKLREADEIAARITVEAGIFGIPADFRKKYMAEKILDMIDQIAENREMKFKGIKPSYVKQNQKEKAV